MNDLKTLKDLKLTEQNGWGQSFVNLQELRQEAIKWAEHYYERALEAEGDHLHWCCGKIDVLQEFFNITDKDIDYQKLNSQSQGALFSYTAAPATSTHPSNNEERLSDKYEYTKEG